MNWFNCYKMVCDIINNRKRRSRSWYIYLRTKTTTRRGVVAKKVSFPPQNDDEKGCRRQKKWVLRPKATTRKGLVAKKWRFPHRNDDEKGCRRQKIAFSVSKRRRERVSSPKKEVFRHKMTTRKGLVAKKVSFPPQNDDEKGCRRQKIAFSVSKRRRERVSSPKKEVSGAKTTTRKSLVAKKWSFPYKNDDEK
ncbi:hypothetical protein [Caldifermentibacillus hisashii]|uniref:hypothetical protein n=1 Tax=Caldifermentibacillus hisashii TaxID=996558 RepID=UPI0031019C2D